MSICLHIYPGSRTARRLLYRSSAHDPLIRRAHRGRREAPRVPTHRHDRLGGLGLGLAWFFIVKKINEWPLGLDISSVAENLSCRSPRRRSTLPNLSGPKQDVKQAIHFIDTNIYPDLYHAILCIDPSYHQSNYHLSKSTITTYTKTTHQLH